jgi:hypothetical protein
LLRSFRLFFSSHLDFIHPHINFIDNQPTNQPTITMKKTTRQTPKFKWIENNRRSRMYNSSTTSDVDIHFSGQTIHAHKATLSEYSEAFYRAFQGPFAKESSYAIETEEYDAPAVEALLKHISSLPCKVPETVEVNLDWYLQLYLIAVEYRVDSFESEVLDLIRTEVFQSKQVSSNEEIFKTCCQQIENLYKTNALPMSLFNMMARQINARDKYKGIREEIIRDKDRRRQQKAGVAKEKCVDLLEQGGGKDGKANWMSGNFEEEVRELTKAERRKQSYEKKTRAKKYKDANGGCRGFLEEY